MKLSILHLSDIHIRNRSDDIVEKSGLIASGFYEYARAADKSLILISGDIAYSGSSDEYDAAAHLIKEIQNKIHEETKRKIDVIMAPGNHDCALIPEDEVRTAIIEKIVADNELMSKDQFVDVCTEAQNEYFKFRDSVTDVKSVYDHKLWTEYEIEHKNSIVRVSAINASWMSRLPEMQGQLVFPFKKFLGVIKEKSNLRVSLIHHPLNWYSQNTYHPLKAGLRSYSDAVFSGHEHSISSGEVKETKDVRSLYFEAPALQPHDSEKSGFVCLMFDCEKLSVSEKRYSIDSSKLNIDGEERTHDLPGKVRQVSNDYPLTEKMQEFLHNAGGNFTHPEKGQIYADDIFVYPELKMSSAVIDDVIAADELDIVNMKNGRILILGDDKSGKSFLLHRYFIDLHSNGLAPLYLRSNEFNSVSDVNIEKKIKSCSGNQYLDAGAYNTISKNTRVVLLDDIDRLPGGSKNKHKLISYLEENFSTVIVTGSSSVEFSEFVDKEASEAFSRYKEYKLRSFGHRMRHKLIKKWCLCGEINTKIDLDKKIHNVESIVSTVLGKNLVPASPIYLLILMQSAENQQQGDLQSSSFSHYYQYLIIKSLGECGVKVDQFNEVFNYLSQLAWFFKHEDVKDVEITKLRNFNTVFSDKFTSVDFDERIKILCKAQILTKDDDYVMFQYPYVYYFFLGKYLADHIHDKEIKNLVVSYCESLHDREKARSVLFLSHHRNEPWLIDKISEILSNCLCENEPLELDGDISALNELVDTSMKIIIKDIDVDKNQEKHRRMIDDFERSDNGNNEILETDDAVELSNNINRLMKTSEILGQILKNYYGSIERSKKEEYIKAVFDAPMRMLRSFFENIINDPDQFVNELEKAMKNKSDVTDDKIKKQSRKMAFDLIGLICSGVVASTARFISSDNLKEDVYSVIDGNKSNSYRLIGAASCLMKPGRLPFDNIKKLAGDLRGNVFSFTILQTLIVYHLHMFHTSDKDKQRLCEMSDINFEKVRTISPKDRVKISG